MSLKHLIMPTLSAHFLSRERLLRLRAKAERARAQAGQPHEVHYFHQVDDPYCALMAQALPRLLERYSLVIVPHLVDSPTQAAAPDRPRLVAYSRRDAQLLARHHGLQFSDRGRQPSEPAVCRTEEALLQAIEQGQFLQRVGPLTEALWQETSPALDDLADTGEVDTATATATANKTLAPTRSARVECHVSQSQKLRERLGHYLGATLFYAGEWYWGIDRLYHLEERLQALGLLTQGVSGLMFPPDEDLTSVPGTSPVPPIDFYFSFRSPYSAIVAERVFELARHSGATVRLRYLLPMVMRGLPVPAAKRRYIALDAAREAHARHTPFGRINDPVGRPVERGLSLMPLAERQGRGQAYVVSFMRGVWAEGLHAGSDRDLRVIAERAGLDWMAAKAAMASEEWRTIAEANRQELLSLGLWGVPSFRVGDLAVWGQDRLWAVQDALGETSTKELDT